MVSRSHSASDLIQRRDFGAQGFLEISNNVSVCTAAATTTTTTTTTIITGLNILEVNLAKYFSTSL